jgi:hypothetical protein
MSTSPTITLQGNHPRKEQLERKLMEYRERLEPLKPPAPQMDTICKIAVLEALLSDNRLNTHDLSQELFQKYGKLFDLKIFDVACSVIIDYCDTGGQNVWGGTGLN